MLCNDITKIWVFLLYPFYIRCLIPSSIKKITMSNAKLWGIDLGGTKIECAVLDSNLDTIIRKRIPTEADKGYPHILSQIKKLIEQVSEEIGEKPSAIGFATPGALEPGTRVMK